MRFLWQLVFTLEINFYWVFVHFVLGNTTLSLYSIEHEQSINSYVFVTVHYKNNWVFHKNNWVNTP